MKNTLALGFGLAGSLLLAACGGQQAPDNAGASNDLTITNEDLPADENLSDINAGDGNAALDDGNATFATGNLADPANGEAGNTL